MWRFYMSLYLLLLLFLSPSLSGMQQYKEKDITDAIQNNEVVVYPIGSSAKKKGLKASSKNISRISQFNFVRNNPSCNAIVKLNLTRNNLYKSYFPEIGASLKNLETLVMSHNHIRMITDNEVGKLPSSLKTLNLSHNDITVFEGAHFLKESGFVLKLSWNKLSPFWQKKIRQEMTFNNFDYVGHYGRKIGSTALFAVGAGVQIYRASYEGASAYLTPFIGTMIANPIHRIFILAGLQGIDLSLNIAGKLIKYPGAKPIIATLRWFLRKKPVKSILTQMFPDEIPGEEFVRDHCAEVVANQTLSHIFDFRNIVDGFDQYQKAKSITSLEDAISIDDITEVVQNLPGLIDPQLGNVPGAILPILYRFKPELFLLKAGAQASCLASMMILSYAASYIAKRSLNTFVGCDINAPLIQPKVFLDNQRLIQDNDIL
jgi:hypothetical protein